MTSLNRQRLILGVVIIITVIFLTPLLWMFITSLRPTQELFSYPMNIIPKEISLENNDYVFTKMTSFFRYFINSLVVTISTVILVIISSATGGYAFGVREFKGQGLLFMGIILVLTVPYIMYLIPIYMMEDWMGLRNSWFGLILPYVALNLPWGLLIMRGAFSTIPEDIRDASIVDGCNEFQLWYRVMLPMTKPSLAATSIITFVFAWQEYLFASTLMSKNKWQTLPVGIVWLRDELQTLVYGRLGAMIVLAVIPVLVIFYVFRNFFIKGLREGMLKG
jgi:ABC-type glycerol-3-phosphate transport system permease component